MSKVWLQKVCQKCGGDVKALLTVDHIHEKLDGGKKGFPNQQLLCVKCHKTKSKVFALRRNELGRKLNVFESEELNEKFLKGEYKFMRIDNKKRVIA